MDRRWRHLHDLAMRQHGHVATHQVEAAGLTRPARHFQVRAGLLEPAMRGVYRFTTFPPGDREREAAVLPWAGADHGVVSAFGHETALQRYGLSDAFPEELHLTVPRRFRRATPRDVALHRVELLPEDIRREDLLAYTRARPARRARARRRQGARVRRACRSEQVRGPAGAPGAPHGGSGERLAVVPELGGQRLMPFPLDVPAVPVEVHVAERLHALSFPRPDGRENSRVKDLMDVVLLRQAASADGTAVRWAVAASFARRATHGLPERIDVPAASWRREYERLASDLGFDAAVRTVQGGVAVLEELLDTIHGDVDRWRGR